VNGAGEMGRVEPGPIELKDETHFIKDKQSQTLVKVVEMVFNH
jgi:hypothetical protein